MMTETCFPSVSMPNDNGVTSMSNNSVELDNLTPERIAPWTAAPYATASSGLMDLQRFFPPKNSDNCCWICGTRVLPPTRTISSMSALLILASLSTAFTVSRQRVKKGVQSFSNCARVTFKVPSSPPTSSPMSISTVSLEESSRFVFSAARLALAVVFSSPDRPFFFSSASNQSERQLSKSSPPRCVSPPVAFTSTMPPSMESTETSKVPPPKSKTKTWEFPLAVPAWSNP
mmetsp:Transcript_11027/g.23200  ORF Transcript_11027/g.23200 Transcript_11027/m.23200 type:complete len:231 (-) Transcript_11027:1170-1862(-)